MKDEKKALQIKYFISTKLIGIMFLVMLISSISIGSIAYFTAKDELDHSGEIILTNGVHMVHEAINLKQDEVKRGVTDLDTAQEEIKQLILGPKNADGTRPINKAIDLGENGYFFILDKNANELAHPSIEGQNTWNTLDMSGKEFYVARDIIEKAMNGGGFSYYSWTYPYTERIAPKVSYGEYDETWGWVIIASIYMEDFNKGADRIIQMLTLTFIASFILCSILILKITRHISHPIRRIAQELKNFEDGHMSYVPVTVQNRDEIGLLAHAYNDMAESLLDEMRKRKAYEEELKTTNKQLEQRVAQRTDALNQANEQLTDALSIAENRKNELETLNQNLEYSFKQLKLAQNQLIESEKMAALGSIVAGVAHEINTPLGNCVTLGSHIEFLFNTLQTNYQNKSLTQKEFNQFSEELTESVALLNHNLQKAADLVIIFKQVAVDQQHQIETTFNLKDYLNKILKSLQPQFKHTSHMIHLECPEDLVICSYPGAFSQLFSNLIMNALIHGLKDMENGAIFIKVSVLHSNLMISFSDNGQGIEEQYIKKVFDPFFTINRSQGGTGLGLFIVYNIVTQKLKGDIQIKNRIPQGVIFEITLPLND